MVFSLQLTESIRTFFVLIAFFLILFEHIILIIPLSWLRGKDLIASVVIFLGIFIFFNYTIGFLEVLKPPRSVWEHYLKGKRLFAMGQNDRAEQELLTALQLDPQFYRAYIDLGNIYSMRGEYVKARDCYLRAIKFFQPDPVNLKITYHNLGNEYLDEKDPENAWLYYRKAYQISAKTGYEQRWSRWRPHKYIRSNDKAGFIKAVTSQKMPDRLSRRIDRLTRTLAWGKQKEVFRESLKYLEENDGTVYRSYFLLLMEKALKKIRSDDPDYVSFNAAYREISSSYESERRVRMARMKYDQDIEDFWQENLEDTKKTKTNKTPSKIYNPL